MSDVEDAFVAEEALGVNGAGCDPRLSEGQAEVRGRARRVEAGARAA